MAPYRPSCVSLQTLSADTTLSRMDFLRRIEDDVRNLGVEAKRKNPEVREAAEKALITLRTMRESYVSEVMRGSGSNTPKIAKFRSAEVSAAYILACERVDANPKLVKLSLNGLQMLLNYEVVPPSEAKSILRILSTQAQSGNTEIQLKTLQIVLQLANSLAIDLFASQYLTVENVCRMISLALQLCSFGESSSSATTSVSVSTTAFATVRQLVALVMDATSEILASSGSSSAGNLRSSSAQENLPRCAVLLIKDLAFYLRGKPGEWIRDVSVNTAAALDLLHAILSGWPHLFLFNPNFKALLKHPVCTSLIPLLKTLQEDYVNSIRQKGSNPNSGGAVNYVSPAAMTSRIVKVARCILLDFQHSRDFVLEIETITTCLVHTIQPERGLDVMVRQLPTSSSLLSDGSNNRDQRGGSDGNGNSKHEDQSGGLISRLAITKSSVPGISTISGGIPSKGGSVLALSALIPASMQSAQAPGGSNGVVYIPAHPAGVALEAVLSMFLTDDLCCVIARGENGQDALPTILTSVVLTASCMLAESLAVETNIREFESNARGSQLVTLMEGVLAGSSELDRQYVVRAIHEQLFNGTTTIGSADVMLLAFLILQIATRLLVKTALSTASSKDSLLGPKSKHFFPSSDDGRLVPAKITAAFLSDSWIPPSFPSATPEETEKLSSSTTPALAHEELVSILRKSVATVCERTYDRVQEVCLVLLAKVEDTGVIRRSLGILAEFGLTAGILGLQRTCDSLISTLCRLTVPQWSGNEVIPSYHSQDSSAKEKPQSFQKSTPDNVSPINSTDSAIIFRWRHVQSLIRLTQIVHVLSDVITDWEVIVDSFEQIVVLLLTATTTNGNPTSSQPPLTSLAPNAPPKSQVPPTLPSSGIVLIHEELTSMDVDRIFECIERFKGYTVFFSDESLMRLMTSLVALSLNPLAASFASPLPAPPVTSAGMSTPVSSKHRHASSPSFPSQSTPTGSSQQPAVPPFDIPAHTLDGPAYLLEALSSRALNYSLYAAVEVAKKNAFRISCVWQMVTSHLRMMSSHKVQRIRRVSVAATHDVIMTTLNYLRDESSDISKTVLCVESNNSDSWRSISSTLQSGMSVPQLCDDFLYDGVMPSFESVFVGRCYQRMNLHERCGTRRAFAHSNPSDTGSISRDFDDEPPLLTQADLLSCLKSLSTYSTYSDVRIDVMQGLLELLQGGGQTVYGGWLIIIDLLTTVPASMVPYETLHNPEMSPISNWLNDQLTPASPTPSCPPPEKFHSSLGDYDDLDSSKVWPDAALQIAFFCMKLIVDDFLESLQLDVIKNVVTCLSMFSAQLSDVNISLTSVEMLWKVTDFIMTSSRKVGDEATTTAVLDVMLRRLLFLALDQRPEIRNCATNTLFSAIVTNAPLLSTIQWKRAFDDVIFPLFSRVEARSGLAIKSNEEAKAPEIKRGVKMTLHHSRDNAHKQWSETRVLALRGLSRVMRACVKHLLTEPWFSSHCWAQALEICVFAVQAGDFDLEVCIAGVDSIFDLIKVVSARQYKTKVRATAGMRVVGGALVEEPPATATSVRSREVAHADSLDQVSALAVSEGKQEVCRQALWELAWSAVRMAICYSSVGTDLPIHICKNLQELYVGGIESEFRYSQNVKSLLEILVILARPRVQASVIQRTGQFSILQFEVERPQSEGGDRPLSSTRSSARMGKLGTSQLHRTIMTLLRAIKPHDVLSFSCLVVAISDLCFTGAHYTQMASTNMPPGIVTTEDEDDVEIERRIVFSPVDETLRSDACKYLMQIFSDCEKTTAGSENSTGSGFVVSSDWLATGVEVVLRKFVEGLCDPLLATRASNCKITRPGCFVVAAATATATVTSVASKTTATQESRGFLASLARILTLEDNSEVEVDHHQEVNQESVGATKATTASLSLIPLHISINSAFTPSSVVSPDSWRMFPISIILMEALATVLDSGLPALQTLSLKSGDVAKKSILVLRQLISVVACLISPWHTRLDLFASPPHLPPLPKTTEILSPLGPSVLDILMIPPESSHPHAIADHRHEQQQMTDAIHSATVLNTRIIHAVWSHFLVTCSEKNETRVARVLEPLIHVFVTSSRLILRALSLFANANCADLPLPHDVILPGDHLVFHISILQTVKDLLASLFEKSSIHADMIRIKSRVLLGLLLITRDLTELSSPEQGEGSSPEPSRYVSSFSLHMMCSKFLSALAAMKTEPELLPSTQELMEKLWTSRTASLENPSYDLAALGRWLRAVDDAAQISAAVTSVGDASPRRKSLTSTVPPAAVSAPHPDALDDTSLLRHGQLFLCFDMAKRLLYSSCPSLRSEAANILKEANVSMLLLSHRDLREALDKEKEMNQKLVKELYSIRSAASLQF